jgi:pimeloyl-ACP methyl ester carboxylesterase
MPSRYFARHGYRVFAPDLPGHGRSEGPALDSIEAMADWLAAFLDAVEVREAAVVGHSMGSLVAYAFASRFPERTRKLVLLGVSLPMAVTDALLDAAQDNDHAAIDMANTWSHSARGRVGANDNPGIWMLGAGERLIERSAPGVYHAGFVACKSFKPDANNVIAAETLVIVGDADQMTPAQRGLDVAEHLPDARVVRLASGHSMLSEQPNQVLDALISIV